MGDHDAQGDLKKAPALASAIVLPVLNNDRRVMQVWTITGAHPAMGISHTRIVDTLTRENWLQNAVVRQGPTSIYYTYIVYGGVNPEKGPWKVQVHGNDVNWEFFPRDDDFSQEFDDLTLLFDTQTARTILGLLRAPCWLTGCTGRGNIHPNPTRSSNSARAVRRKARRYPEAQGNARVPNLGSFVQAQTGVL
jgi:hypothetical protein